MQDAREKDGSYQFKLRGYPWTTMDGQDIVHARILTMHIIAKFEALGFELMTTIDMNEGIGDSGDSEFPMDRADGSRHLDLCVQDLGGRGYVATPFLRALRCRRGPWRGTLLQGLQHMRGPATQAAFSTGGLRLSPLRCSCRISSRVSLRHTSVIR